MTNFKLTPNSGGLIKLSGTIKNLKVKRDNASFVFTQSDQSNIGVIAIAASLAGLSGQAMSTASNSSNVEEEADYLEFDLDGQSVRGWVWRSPFKEGDKVEVALEPRNSNFELYGIKRSKDKTIALYPHCSRGKVAHILNAVKSWLIWGGGVLCLIGIPMAVSIVGLNLEKLLSFYTAFLGLMAFFAFMTYSLTRKWLPFVNLAEKVFHTLDLPNPSNIDLVKSSKQQRTDKDPGEFGTFYFRY